MARQSVELYNIVIIQGSEKRTLNRNVEGPLKANRKKVHWMNHFKGKDGVSIEIERSEVRQ